MFAVVVSLLAVSPQVRNRRRLRRPVQHGVVGAVVDDESGVGSVRVVVVVVDGEVVVAAFVAAAGS